MKQEVVPFTISFSSHGNNKPRKQSSLLLQRPRLHHIGLTPALGLGGASYDGFAKRPEVLDQLKKDTVRLWIMQCDARLLLATDGKLARYGRAQVTLGSDLMLCDRIHPEDALQYYNAHPDELPQDMWLCHNVCPVFLLHGFVNLLRTDADLFYGSYETLMMLHCLKSRLIARQQRQQHDIGAFLKRLFQLIEYSVGGGSESSALMARYDHYLAIITVFMTSNVDFMRRVDNNNIEGNDIVPNNWYYEPCVDDVKRCGAIKTLIEKNLLCDTGMVMASTSIWTTTYLELQMNTHCRTIEQQWMSYWECPSTTSTSTTSPLKHKLLPRALELDVPSHDIADANQFIIALMNCEATTVYTSYVIDALANT